jgi:hypothetical protein
MKKMKNKGEVMIQTIDSPDLPTAWLEAFSKCYDSPGGVISPCIVKFGAISESSWNQEIQAKLDKSLKNDNVNDTVFETLTVRNTIFPENLWKMSNGDRQVFYDKYNKSWPKIRLSTQNRHGCYFQRLIDFEHEGKKKNQLEEIITTWNSGIRRKSALQATIFNPFKDLVPAPRLGFPCLQQIVFIPEGTNGQNGLTIVGFYATQDCYRKAFGNYWGLMCLGRFMAEAMDIPFKGVCCIASHYTLGDTKKKLNGLYTDLSKEFEQN